MENQKVWFVTGASKGLGLVLVQKLLANGLKVAATSRNMTDLHQAVSGQTDLFLPLQVDLKNESSVQQAIEKTVATFGNIDIVVNNAGYGLTGSIEELTDSETRENFEVNVFGTLNVIRKAMPYLREQKSGHIFNISSIGGFTGDFPGFAIYCATKFAVVGLTESLAAEVKSFGIKVTVVEPGYFRTNFLTSGSLGTPKNEIAEYKEVREVQNAHQQDINGNQPGDPAKAADVLIRIASEANPPLNLFLGQDAYDLAQAKIEAVGKELENWKEVTISTGFEVEKV
ncbi:oxidoreductase [Dyadobacter arcticus]|uniref:NAD(P)-dependent dehydrogenase (Short-subunit alcohol dehydrogenase family) n=1 Tax=Dyadobacter arcticus TaxID=1078754 RepID=A0ABX0USW4_9BACT|nr:oxidoreductase [Dyadobacter arcticus]NIJ54066.1 NAD(P)-dependent dehydrogenase (short-subunit alcohol dehydrogenase family) [Dyadobacter arcticus]